MREDNRCPEGYPVFRDGGFHKNLLVDEGTYIVDRYGRVCVTTTSNKWEKLQGSVQEWNQGFVRARYFSNKGDFLTYSNQIRLATAEEVEKTRKWAKSVEMPYEMDKNGQFRLC